MSLPMAPGAKPMQEFTGTNTLSLKASLAEPLKDGGWGGGVAHHTAN